jgi:hypothetical protein
MEKQSRRNASTLRMTQFWIVFTKRASQKIWNAMTLLRLQDPAVPMEGTARIETAGGNTY